jgi:hypothetical protein
MSILTFKCKLIDGTDAVFTAEDYGLRFPGAEASFAVSPASSPRLRSCARMR